MSLIGLNTYIVVTGNKVSDKVTVVMCRGFKMHDDAVVAAGKLLKASSIWMSSPTFLNLNSFLSSFPSEDKADTKWLSLAMSMLT